LFWVVSLAVSSLAAVVFSVTSLVYPGSRSQDIDYSALLISLVTLVASLVVALMNFGARSVEMKNAYRRAQRLSSRAEYLRKVGDQVERKLLLADVGKLTDDYQDLLDESENHTTADFVGRLIEPVRTRVPKNSPGDQRLGAPDPEGDVAEPSAPTCSSSDGAAGAQHPSEWKQISIWGWLSLIGSGSVTLVPLVLATLVVIMTCLVVSGSLL